MRNKLANEITTSRRGRSITKAGRFRGGLLRPLSVHRLRTNEGGLMSENVMLELDQLAGRMITPITGGVVSVFVPLQALHALANPDEDYAGVAEVIKDKLTSGQPLFELEAPNDITKALGIEPIVLNGELKVSSTVALAHNCAVNYLRRRAYHDTVLLDETNRSITPALMSTSALTYAGGVLDPDENVNGAVNFKFPNLNIPVSGLGTNAPVTDAYTAAEKWSAGESRPTSHRSGGNSSLIATDSDGYPQVFAKLAEDFGGQISLTDFYNAEVLDRFTRKMDSIREQHPEHGDEMLVRWAHGLTVDAGQQPFVLYQKEQIFGVDYRRAGDGDGLTADTSVTNFMTEFSFTVPVPRSELGGVVINFTYVKPDETLQGQPDPDFTEPWVGENRLAESLLLDAKPVINRQLTNDIDIPEDETTVSFYTGHNALKRTYVNYGWDGLVDENDVEEKTALWQIGIPLSQTPQSVIYPSDLEHYPWNDQLADICTYMRKSTFQIATEMQFGPTPVEKLAVVEDEDLYEEDEVSPVIAVED